MHDKEINYLNRVVVLVTALMVVAVMLWLLQYAGQGAVPYEGALF